MLPSSRSSSGSTLRPWAATVLTVVLAAALGGCSVVAVADAAVTVVATGVKVTAKAAGAAADAIIPGDDEEDED